MPQKTIYLEDMLKVLELPLSALDFVKLSYEEALSGLNCFKDDLAIQKKRLAKKYHPRKLEDDETRMKSINNAVDVLMSLHIQRVQPVYRPIFSYYYHADSASTATTTMHGTCTI